VTALAKVNAWSIAPTSLGELMQFAKLISDSELVPKDYRGKPGNVVIAIQMGADVGLSPMQAIQSIAVINGRASMWGDTLLALVQAHPDFEDIQEAVDNGVATCTLKLRNRQPTVRTFSREDAKTAGLWGKQGPWQTAPQRMLQMRARGFCLRDGAAYILRGFHSAEEQSDIIEARVVGMDDVKVTKAPAPAPDPKQLPESNLPTSTTKNYPDKQWAGVPFQSLTHSALIAYLEYYTKRLPSVDVEKHRKAVEATIEAAQAEAQRRLDAEASEVPSDIQ
jgi:hypothetical protein